MKNFLRALRYAWPYRMRLGISVACATVAAVLWGLTFTSISPTLAILVKKQNLQEWARAEVAKNEKEVDRLDALHVQLKKKVADLAQRPPDALQEKDFRDLTRDISRAESDLLSANRRMYLYLVAERFCGKYLPKSPFLTLVWVIVLVVFGVLLRGFFEFWQDSLVGSVVNLSLYDLRNRLYRNVIHLDVNNFSEDGTHELMARFTNDMEMLGAGIKTLFGKVVAEPLKALVCVVIACWVCWQLTLM